MRKELMAVNEKMAPFVGSLKRIEQEMYRKFLSETAYHKARLPIPWPHVSATLRQYEPWTCRWGSYTGYCESVEGKLLLAEKAQVETELEALNNERNDILRPFRRNLAEKKYAKDCAEYEQRVADYESQLPVWEEKRREWEVRRDAWEANAPKEVLPVGWVDRDEVTKESDPGHLFPRWGINKGRNASWRFVWSDGRSPSKVQVSVERPKAFPECEPQKPWKPSEPQKPVFE